jgi:hypothetical protein
MGHSWRPWKRIFRLEPGPEVNEELRFHVEQRIADYMERGMTPEEARHAAEERLAVALDQALDGIVMGGQTMIVLPIVSVLFMVVELLAALGPARRGLAVQPTEALRFE